MRRSLARQQRDETNEPDDFSAVQRGDTAATFKQLDDTIFDDFHATLLDLKNAPEINVWGNLLDHTGALHKSLQILQGQEPENLAMKSAAFYSFLEKRAYELLLYDQKLIDEFAEYKDSSVLANLVITNPEFRMIYAVWRWCQDGSGEGSEGYADLANTHNKIVATVANARADSLRALKEGQTKYGVDVDADRTEEDLSNENDAMRVVFSLIRCFKISEAIDLLYKIGEPSLAAGLRMYLFLSDPELSPCDKNHENYAIGLKRPQFLKTFARLANNPDQPMHNRLVWASLSGCLPPLLSMATRTTDRLWSMANCALIHILNEAITGVSLQESPKTTESIFGEITTEEKSPYYAIYGYLLRDDWDGLITYIVEYLDSRASYDQRIDDQTVRFFGSLATIARLKQCQHDELAACTIYSALIDRLVKKKLFSLVPFFASFLSRQDADDRLLDIMEHITGDVPRAEYLLALEAADFDRDTMVVAAGSEVGNNSPEARINNLNWLLVNGERTLDSTVEQINCLVRYFAVKLEDRKMAESVLQLAHNFGIPNKVAELKNSVEYEEMANLAKYNMEEYECHMLFYFEALPNCEKFAHQTMEMQNFILKNPRPLDADPSSSKKGLRTMNLARDTERHVEQQRWDNDHQRCKTIVEMTKQKAMQSCEKFLTHRGYRYATNDQPGKISELKKMRNYACYTIVNFVISSCAIIQDVQGIIDMTVLIARPQLGVEELIEKDDLRKLLQSIVKYTGATFS